MIQVTIDPDLKRKLQGLLEPVEFCDEAGKVLGHFVPTAPSAFQLPAGDACPYSEEQLRTMHADRDGVPLSQILRKLETQ